MSTFITLNKHAPHILSDWSASYTGL